jgi:hypothetical protein
VKVKVIGTRGMSNPIESAAAGRKERKLSNNFSEKK